MEPVIVASSNVHLANNALMDNALSCIQLTQLTHAGLLNVVLGQFVKMENVLLKLTINALASNVLKDIFVLMELVYQILTGHALWSNVLQDTLALKENVFQ